VELFAPVRSADGRKRLDQLFDRYLTDRTAWDLTAQGEYVRRDGRAPGAQDSLLDEAAAALR
jgi:hypothetical protein